MPRPKTAKPVSGQPFHLSVTVDGALIVALDAEAARCTKTDVYKRTVTRSDVLRLLIKQLADGKEPKEA